tara:strand:+ start:204 stop:389 length:186 start_codon:yes stop_codon:yes gene_type:complete
MQERTKRRLQKELETTRSKRRRASIEKKLGWSRVEVAPELVVEKAKPAVKKKTAKKAVKKD